MIRLDENWARITVLTPLFLCAVSCGTTANNSISRAEVSDIESFDGSFPTKIDLGAALFEIDNEFCRKTIDICASPISVNNYNINIIDCDSISSDQVKCVIQDVRGDLVYRECSITMNSVRNDNMDIWQIARGRQGSSPRALLTSCES